MTTVLSHEAFHASVGHAFGELLVMEQISQLPPDSILRILQTIPESLLREALAGCGTPSAPQAAQAEHRAFPRRKVLRGAQLLREGGCSGGSAA
jgi:hypothetical protein